MWEKVFIPTVLAGEVLAQGDTPHRVHWTLYADGTFTLTMPASAVTVKASFVADPAQEPAAEPTPAEGGCTKDGTCPVSRFTDTSPDRGTTTASTGP